MTNTETTKKELSPEVFQAIRRIEDIGGSLSAQAYSYRESATDNRPLVAKDIFRLIGDMNKAEEKFRSVLDGAE